MTFCTIFALPHLTNLVVVGLETWPKNDDRNGGVYRSRRFTEFYIMNDIDIHFFQELQIFVHGALIFTGIESSTLSC